MKGYEDVTCSVTFSDLPVEKEDNPTLETHFLSLRMKQWRMQCLPFEDFSKPIKDELSEQKPLSYDHSRELTGLLANYAYGYKPYPNRAKRLEVCEAVASRYPT